MIVNTRFKWSWSKHLNIMIAGNLKEEFTKYYVWKTL